MCIGLCSVLFSGQRKNSIIFEKYKTFCCSSSCQCTMLLFDFLSFIIEFICIFIWIFKKSETIFKTQNPVCRLIDEFFRNLAFLYQLFQMLNIDFGHHINIDTGFYSQLGSFIFVLCDTMLQKLPDSSPVRNDYTVESPFFPKDSTHKCFIG